jgi:hypothetical protein
MFFLLSFMLFLLQNQRKRGQNTFCMGEGCREGMARGEGERGGGASNVYT